MKNKFSIIIVSILVVACILIFVNYHINKFNNFKTLVFDFGYCNNLIYNTFNGKSFYTSFYRWNQLDGRPFNSLGDHLFLTLPFYSVFLILSQHPLVPNIIQVLTTALSILLIYKISIHTCGSKLISLLITFTYALNKHFLYLCAYDLHFEIVVCFLIPLLYLFLLKKKKNLTIIICLLMLMMKETLLFSICFLFLALYIFFKRKLLLVFFIFCVFYIFLAIQIIIPHFIDNKSIKEEYRSRYTDVITDSNRSVIAQVAEKPFMIMNKLASKQTYYYLREHFSGVFFLPLFNPLTYSVLPTFVINNLSASYVQRLIYFQYNPDVLSVSFISYILLISLLLKKIKRGKSNIFILCLLILIFQAKSTLSDNPFNADKSAVSNFESLHEYNFGSFKNFVEALPEKSCVGVDQRCGGIFYKFNEIEYLDFNKAQIPPANFYIFYFKKSNNSNYNNYFIMLIKNYKLLYYYNGFYALKGKI